MFSPGHRTLYIGVHVPLGRRSHRRHRHHGHRHRKRSKERDSTAEDGRESPSHSRSRLNPTSSNWLTLIFSKKVFLRTPNKTSHWIFHIKCVVLFSCIPSPVPLAAADTPAQRVQFLLGTEDGDEEHIPHALFTELDEICLREGEDAEWKETARCVAAVGHMDWIWPAVATFYVAPVSVWLQAYVTGLLLRTYQLTNFTVNCSY